jgi:hypothetical protein
MVVKITGGIIGLMVGHTLTIVTIPKILTLLMAVRIGPNGHPISLKPVYMSYSHSSPGNMLPSLMHIITSVLMVARLL